MILIDAGPLIALFDPKDRSHRRCRDALRRLEEPLYTTAPVLTEAFHLLDPGSRGSATLRGFVLQKGVAVWHLDDASLRRAFVLMEKYRDHPMDLADASIVVAAEALGTRKVPADAIASETRPGVMPPSPSTMWTRGAAAP